MADGGLPNGAHQHINKPPKTPNDLCKHVVTFQKYADISLLLPSLTTELTKDEIHRLKNESLSERQRIYDLITEFLPKKAPSILDTLKQTLVDSLAEDGSSGHRIILQEVFGDSSYIVNPSVSKGEKSPVNADDISEESECFIDFLRKFRKELESGAPELVSQRLQDVTEYFCHIRKKDGAYYLKENVRTELCSDNLNFVKLFNCLDSKSKPPVISEKDVSVLHRIIKVLSGDDKNSREVVARLTQLLKNYEFNAGIISITHEPVVSPESAVIKAKVTNADNGNPWLINGIKKLFFESLKFNFLGSGKGSVVLYWEFPKEYYQKLLKSFEEVYKSKNFSIDRFKITKVEACSPHQIYLEMEITDPDLLHLSQQQHFVTDEFALEQEKFIILLININRLVGSCVSDFLSTEEVTSTLYSCFKGDTFYGMTNKLIFQSKLHCYDISFLQLFLLFVYKRTSSDRGESSKALVTALKETQDYEPLPTGSPLSSMEFRCRSRPIMIVTQVSNINCISYEVMVFLKYGISELLHISQSSFQYVSWKLYNHMSIIVWHTTEANFDKIEPLLCFQENLSNGFLKVTGDPEIDYHFIKLNCEITNKQMLLDGSPLLVPDVEGKPLFLCYVYCNQYSYSKLCDYGSSISLLLLDSLAGLILYLPIFIANPFIRWLQLVLELCIHQCAP